MELDEMKLAIRQKLESEPGQQHSETTLLPTAKGTHSMMNSIKRNIWLELVAFIICMAVAAWIWPSYTSPGIHLFCIATWVFSAVFGGYLFALYRKIVFYESMPATVRENLQQLIILVTRFTRLYFRVSVGLLPVVFIFGLIAGYLDVSRQGLLQQFHWSRGVSFYVLFFFSWSVLLYFFAKWYIKNLYGNYLLQLQQQLKEIENG